jgi:hypothetical protein
MYNETEAVSYFSVKRWRCQRDNSTIMCVCVCVCMCVWNNKQTKHKTKTDVKLHLYKTMVA